MSKYRLSILVVVVIISFFCLNSCSFMLFGALTEDLEGLEKEESTTGDDSNSDNSEIVDPDILYSIVEITDQTFTLAWDTSDTSVETYRLYYKILDTTEVQEIEEVVISSEDDIQVEIDATQFSKNTYIVLGVAAVDSEGEMSDIHFSTDNTAIPEQGWVLEVI